MCPWVISFNLSVSSQYIGRVSPCRLYIFILKINFTAANAGDAEDTGFIPRSGRFPGGGNGNPLQYSCLENPMERGDCCATVHGVTKSQTRLSHWAQHSSSSVLLWVLPPFMEKWHAVKNSSHTDLASHGPIGLIGDSFVSIFSDSVQGLSKMYKFNLENFNL